MHTVNKKSLRRKGWGKREFAKAKKILGKETAHGIHFSKVVFWTALLLAIIGNLLVAIALIPFLIVLTPGLLYAVIIILAGVMGFLYMHLVIDIGHLGKQHHFAAMIILPVVAFVNAMIMVIVANRIISDLPFIDSPGHNPGMIGAVFAVAFILPYVYNRFVKKN